MSKPPDGPPSNRTQMPVRTVRPPRGDFPDPSPAYPSGDAAGIGGSRSQLNNNIEKVSDAANEVMDWTSHQSPCAAALCILGFLLAVFMCCVIATTTIFMNKTHSTWAQKQDLTLCGLENSLIQDPEAKLYMWWMVSSILLFMFLLFYNAVAWAWYIVMTEQAPMGWLRAWAKNHTNKKKEQNKKKSKEHAEGIIQRQQDTNFRETGQYFPGQRGTRAGHR